MTTQTNKPKIVALVSGADSIASSLLTNPDTTVFYDFGQPYAQAEYDSLPIKPEHIVKIEGKFDYIDMWGKRLDDGLRINGRNTIMATDAAFRFNADIIVMGLMTNGAIYEETKDWADAMSETLSKIGGRKIKIYTPLVHPNITKKEVYQILDKHGIDGGKILTCLNFSDCGECVKCKHKAQFVKLNTEE